MVAARLASVQVVTFEEGDAQPIDRFGSHAASVNHLARVDGPGAVVAIRLGPGGKIGRHPAVRTQLFVVVDGAGLVSGDDGAQVAITAGQAALWEAGERHESFTATGMTAIVIEVADVAPA
jgi:mannose-6-phosphate isomerase-like protein (cupin superfamily)